MVNVSTVLVENGKWMAKPMNLLIAKSASDGASMVSPNGDVKRVMSVIDSTQQSVNFPYTKNCAET